MEITNLQQWCKDQLLRAGVDGHRAEQAIHSLTWEQLQLVSQILPERQVLPQLQS